ncbi:hypothetical protein SAMN04488515_1520 [Cognatiyoonia koreensis]|uniref:Membrane-anchored ribosome-binding protein, inhibits growth in stationary phase, ElaB/YqjD/DUF883 family n=1 Tax=Cognatiyoonia koreensis TaxID=364200 RepID=A0A1I0PXN7_9RHOB|nr:hypothetical protein [Cognatiyoonia koreensis]SEW19387.1 hypothetical protein SAMN04488515_1520 [Cognatiyoonia koreensis]
MSDMKSVRETGKETLKKAKSTAKTGAKALRDTATSTVQEQAESAKDALANGAASKAEQLHAVADQMTEGAPHTEAVEAAAARVQAFADKVRTTDPANLAADTAELARRHPIAALSVAALAGFAVGRFVRSSGRTLDQQATDTAVDHGLTPDQRIPS